MRIIDTNKIKIRKLQIKMQQQHFLIAITIGVRILGPALGFMVGSLCTRFYADLSMNPKIPTTDPRWIGAWWLGRWKTKGA